MGRTFQKLTTHQKNLQSRVPTNNQETPVLDNRFVCQFEVLEATYFFLKAATDPDPAETESSSISTASKIPWKIRAARKRAMKHHTTGMTKDEFEQIKASLRESQDKRECTLTIKSL